MTHVLYLAGAEVEALAFGAASRQWPKVIYGSFVVLVVEKSSSNIRMN